MIDTILGVLRANGPLPESLLMVCCQEEGVTVTSEDLVAAVGTNELRGFEFDRPDSGVFRVYAHPKARYRCLNRS